MPVNPAVWIQNNLTLAVTGLLALFLLAWAYEAYEEAEDRREALEGFGGRAKEGTGSVLNVVLVSIVTVVGWAGTTFETAGEAVAFLLGVAPELPVMSASVLTIGLGAIGLSDMIVLRAWHFVAISMMLLILAVAFKTDFGEVSLE